MNIVQNWIHFLYDHHFLVPSCSDLTKNLCAGIFVPILEGIRLSPQTLVQQSKQKTKIGLKDQLQQKLFGPVVEIWNTLQNPQHRLTFFFVKIAKLSQIRFTFNILSQQNTIDLSLDCYYFCRCTNVYMWTKLVPPPQVNRV